MDIRTHGKDFEKYYNRAKDEIGVRFIRSRVHQIDRFLGTEDLQIRYATEDGKIETEDFDMVVLSVGLDIPKETIELARRLDIELDHYNFATSSSFNPVATTRNGIYVCGVFRSPKDIPETVMEASAAACASSIALAEARNTLVKEKTYPPEKDVSEEEPRIGVFVCHCGINIASVVNVPEIVEYASTLPNVVVAERNLFTCSQDTQKMMKELIEEHNLNRIVVASCTPRTHEPLFRETIMEAGLNKYLFEMANIRDQCSWVHMHEPERATEKAKDLVRMAVAKARLIKSLPEATLPVTKVGLVIGGGVSGMVSALSLAKQGYQVHLVESKDHLGGNALKLVRTWKGEKVSPYLNELIKEVNENDLITVHLGSKVEDASGFVGNFKSRLSNGIEIDHGVIILATGAHAYEPNGDYLYGKNSNVFLSLDLDKEIAEVSERLKRAKVAAFIQCVGSRIPERPYCSKVCCTHSVENALTLKEMNPDMDIYILYRDIRTYGEREDIYRDARAKGIIFIRYDLDDPPKVEEANGGIRITVKDHVLGRPLVITPDILTLAAAIVPNDNEVLSKLYKVPLNQEGFFLEAHMKLRPVDFATDGIFLAGLCHYPKPLDESISQAQAASARAGVILSKDTLIAEGIISYVNEALCRGCGLCKEACLFGAIELIESAPGILTSTIKEALCKGCGACAAICPTGAASLKHFEDDEVLTMVESALKAA
jgi:heterodisulfide reductase subunit A